MHLLVRCLAAASLAASLTAPSTAQKNAQSPASQQGTIANPNEVICEKQKVLGSRLAARRVCKTRAEWADLRLQDRLEVEKVQTARGLKN